MGEIIDLFKRKNGGNRDLLKELANFISENISDSSNIPTININVYNNSSDCAAKTAYDMDIICEEYFFTTEGEGGGKTFKIDIYEPFLFNFLCFLIYYCVLYIV